MQQWREFPRGYLGLIRHFYNTWHCYHELAYETVDRVGPTGVTYKEGRNWIYLHFDDPNSETLFRIRYRNSI